MRPANVAIWGRVPPPIGGMSMHVKRLMPYLAGAGISTQMYSVGRRTPEHPDVRQVSERRIGWLLQLLFGACEPVHYVLSDNTSARLAASMLAAIGRARVILRVGGESLAQAADSRRFLERWAIRFAMRHASVVVGVNDEICRLATRLGAKRVVRVPGFIPESTPAQSLPDEVAAFVTARAGPVLLASGEVRDPGDKDLYGAYALLELVERLPAVRLVFYAYRITLGEGPQKQLAEEIRRRGLHERYLLFTSSTDLLPAMVRADALIRPTLSDGDSNSIREALHLGVPVIASDCVERPEGVVTFATADPASLQGAVVRVLADIEEHRRRVRSLARSNNAVPIVELFQSLLQPDAGAH